MTFLMQLELIYIRTTHSISDLFVSCYSLKVTQ